MAVILVGEIVNSADTTTGFNVGNISEDDDFVEGVGAIGLKASVGVTEMYTDSLGSTAPYNFSAATDELGAHIIQWFNTKTPIDQFAGIRIVVGNGTDRGNWYVLGSGFYKGGFITRVVDTQADFDSITAGTWTLTGNPSQLSNVTEMGGGFQTLTSIMGNFNNIQLDQFCIGSGVRVNGGTDAAPNDFETVRVADEDTNFWGWWSSAFGSFVGKGKIFVGPQDGHDRSHFSDSAVTVTFADERVASGFYDINLRGGQTSMYLNLTSINAANPNNSRWNITVDNSVSGFFDSNGVYTGADTISITPSSQLNGTTIINSNEVISPTGLGGFGASITGCTILSAPTASSDAFLICDRLDDIEDCSFIGDGTGHAVRLREIKDADRLADEGLTEDTMTWNNTATGFAATSGSTGDETIFVDVATGGLTINVLAGASVPSVRTAGCFINLVIAPVTTTIKVVDSDGGAIQDARVYLTAAAGGPITEGTVIFNTLTDVNGEVSDTRSLASDQPITGYVRKGTNAPRYKQGNITATIDSAAGVSITVQLVDDE